MILHLDKQAKEKEGCKGEPREEGGAAEGSHPVMTQLTRQLYQLLQ